MERQVLTAARTVTYICVTVALRASQLIQVLVFIDLQPSKKTPLRALIELRETWLDGRPLGAIPFTIEDQMDEYKKVPVNSLGIIGGGGGGVAQLVLSCNLQLCTLCRVLFQRGSDLLQWISSAVVTWGAPFSYSTRE